MCSDAACSFASDHPSRLEDADILDRARGGCRDAMGTLLLEGRGRLLAQIRRRMSPTLKAHVESTDILQITWLHAFRSIGQFEGTSRESFAAWLAGIAHHAIGDHVDYLRRGRRDVYRTVPLNPEVEAMASDPDTEVRGLMVRDEQERLARALASLPAVQREVIRLRTYEEMSFKEIGERLGKSPDACRMILARALRTLARKMRSARLDRAGAVTGRVVPPARKKWGTGRTITDAPFGGDERSDQSTPACPEQKVA